MMSGINAIPSESVSTLVVMTKKNCALIEDLIGHLLPIRNSLYRARYPAAYSAEKARMAISLAIQTTELLQLLVNRLEECDTAKRDSDNIHVVDSEGDVEK